MANNIISRITINNTCHPDLIFRQLTGEERLSSLYHFTVECLSTRDDLDFHTLLGNDMALEIPLAAGGCRYLHGHITRVEFAGRRPPREHYRLYRFSLRPTLWYLTLNKDCRIWQETALPDIITALLAEYHISIENALTRHYRPYENCVQYQESAFDFISRLMEHEGLYYYFKHTAGGHVMVLCDAPEAHRHFAGYDEISYQRPGFGLTERDEGIQSWSAAHAITAGLCILDDYDFRKPRAHLLEARPHQDSLATRKAEVFDWPGGHNDNRHGQFLAGIRQQALEAGQQKITGLTTARGMAPGHTFRINQCPRPVSDPVCLVIGMTYRIRDFRFFEDTVSPDQSPANGRSEFSADFETLPASLTWRPARKTPWPKTRGPQTAEVTGPPGKSIWTDKYGRIKLKFRWDRHGPGDDTGSGWVRVSSGWAGWKYGSMQVPRVGEEVIVDFINGDPDRPIVTGRVYNEDALPPWELPAHATRMGFMSRSKDGGIQNASYLFLEDAPGGELFALHAERDMRLSVEHDYQGDIDGNLAQKVSGRSAYTYLGPSHTLKAGPDSQIFQLGKTSMVAGGRADIIQGGDYRQVDGNIERYASATLSCRVGATLSHSARENLMFDAGKRIIYGDSLPPGGSDAHTGNDALRRYREAGPPQTGMHADEFRPDRSRPTDILYSRGKTTHIEGEDNLTVARNQIHDIKGDAKRNVRGKSQEHSSDSLGIRSDADMSLESGGEMRVNAKSLTRKIQGAAETHALTSLNVAGTTQNIDGMNIAVSQTAIHTRNLMMSTKMVNIANTGMRMETIGVDIGQGQLDIRTTLLSLHTSALTIFI